MPFPNKATQFRSGAEQVAISRKGGLSKSPRKKFASHLRHLKNGCKIDKNQMEKCFSFFKEEEFCSADQLAWIEQLRKRLDELYESGEISYNTYFNRANTLMCRYQAIWEGHHGKKIRIDEKSMKINVEISKEDAIKRIEKIINN